MGSKSLFVLLLAIAAVGATACGHGKTACAVVDAADKACTVVRYMEPDGTVREVQVDRDEVNAFGRQAAARKRNAAPPAGSATPPPSEPEKGSP